MDLDDEFEELEMNEDYVEGSEEAQEGSQEEVDLVEEEEGEEMIKVTIERSTKVNEKQVEFQLKIEKKNIPNGYQKVNSVILMIKIKSEQNFQEIKMQNKKESEVGLIYYHNMKIVQNEEYQYFYKVGSDSENQYRQYKYDSNLENGVDEWNKIWVGYRFNHKKHILQQQTNQTNETFKLQKSSMSQFLENFQLVENTDIFRTFEDQMINEKNQSKGQLVQRSNYLIFQFSDDFIYNQHKNSVQKKQNKENDFSREMTREIQFQSEKFDLHKEIYSNYTNNLNSILEEIIQESTQVSNEQIQNLLKPIEIPHIIVDPAFEKCKQTLIIINNNVEELKQNKSRMQNEFDTLKKNYDQGIQELNDYEKISQKQNNKNQELIKKLRQELNLKIKEIENLQKEINQSQIQYRIRMLEAKQKYHQDIAKKEQELIDKDESLKNEKQLNLDSNKKIILLEIDNFRLKALIKEKDIFIMNSSDCNSSLLKQIQNYKDLLQLKRLK